VDPFSAEALTAAIGPDAILKSRAVVNRRTLGRAAAAPRLLTRLLRRIIERDSQSRPRALPSPAYNPTGKLLAASVPDEDSPPPKWVNELADVIHVPDVLFAVTEVTLRVAGALQEVFPRKVRQTATGAVVVQPNEQDWATFRRRYQVAMDPWMILQRAGAGMLAQSDMAWLERTWPGFKMAIEEAVPIVLASAHGGKESFHLSGAKDRIMLLLRGVPSEQSPAVPAIQQAYASSSIPSEATEPAASKASDKPIKMKVGDEATPEQRREAPQA
jgi:hypothetical protein